MAINIQGAVTGVSVDADDYDDSLHVSAVPRGAVYSVSSVTGTIAAAVGANSAVFAMRNGPSTGVNVYITKLRIRWTCITAFTTPVTASRRIAVYRGSGAAASGGTALATAAKHLSTDAASACDSAQGGDMRIATTGALTVTGIAFESQEIRTMAVTGFGAAGATIEDVYEFVGHNGPFILKPGELMAIRNPVAMDAGGTWQLDVDVTWFQV